MMCEMMGFGDGCGISWTICKQSAPLSRQITTPTPHHSIFTGRVLFLTPNQQRQSTDGKLWYRPIVSQTSWRDDMPPPMAVLWPASCRQPARRNPRQLHATQPACCSLGWDKQTDGQTDGSRYRLMPPVYGRAQ